MGSEGWREEKDTSCPEAGINSLREKRRKKKKEAFGLFQNDRPVAELVGKKSGEGKRRGEKMKLYPVVPDFHERKEKKKKSNFER